MSSSCICLLMNTNNEIIHNYIKSFGACRGCYNARIITFLTVLKYLHRMSNPLHTLLLVFYYPGVRAQEHWVHCLTGNPSVIMEEPPHLLMMDSSWPCRWRPVALSLPQVGRHAVHAHTVHRRLINSPAPPSYPDRQTVTLWGLGSLLRALTRCAPWFVKRTYCCVFYFFYSLWNLCKSSKKKATEWSCAQ